MRDDDTLDLSTEQTCANCYVNFCESMSDTYHSDRFTCHLCPRYPHPPKWVEGRPKVDSWKPFPLDKSKW